MSNAISVYRGDEYITLIEFTDDTTGVPIDITNYVVRFTVRIKGSLAALTNVSTDSDALISKKITIHTSPTGGITTLSLAETDTNIDPGTYVYDIQIKNTSNNVQTILKDNFIVIGDVTRANDIS